MQGDRQIQRDVEWLQKLSPGIYRARGSKNVDTTVMPVNLTGRWAIVTGGSKGIGHAIAHALAGAGANLVLIARGGDALASARKDLLLAVPDVEVHIRSADMTDVVAIDELFDDLAAAIPRLDILVANAGAGRVTPFLELPIEEWQWTLDLNLTGVFRSVQRAAQRMVADGVEGDRSILVVSSIRAEEVRTGRLAYSASKAGLNQFARSAAGELASHGIRVNVLSPGITATPLALDPDRRDLFQQAVASVPMGRAGDPDDMARGALYLCSPAAGFVTGANLVIDGGEHLAPTLQ